MPAGIEASESANVFSLFKLKISTVTANVFSFSKLSKFGCGCELVRVLTKLAGMATV